MLTKVVQHSPGASLTCHRKSGGLAEAYGNKKCLIAMKVVEQVAITQNNKTPEN